MLTWIETSTWTKVTCRTAAPEPRYGHASVSLGSNILVFGGANRHIIAEDTGYALSISVLLNCFSRQETVFYDDMWMFNTERAEWVQVTPRPGVCHLLQ